MQLRVRGRYRHSDLEPESRKVAQGRLHTAARVLDSGESRNDGLGYWRS